jgi:TP901-1 family phage major tail protein
MAAAARANLFKAYVEDATNPGLFNLIAKQRTTKMVINGAVVDVSNKDTANWRVGGDQMGLSTAQFDCAGIASKLDIGLELIKAAAFTQKVLNYQLFDEDNGDTFQGAFKVSKFEMSGEHEQAVMYSCTYESMDIVTWTPAAA